MTGIVVTTYKRPEYLRQTLESLRIADTTDCYIAIVDDASNDKEVSRLIDSFEKADAVIKKKQNKGVCDSLRIGFDLLCNVGCNYIMNLDSDLVVKPDFVPKLVRLIEGYPFGIVSGFNTLTADPNTGKPRHPIKFRFEGFVTKQTIGGANMLMGKDFYQKRIRAYIVNDINWDWSVCNYMKRMNKHFTVASPSLIEHIGEISTFTGRTHADKSFDYEQEISELSQ